MMLTIIINIDYYFLHMEYFFIFKQFMAVFKTVFNELIWNIF